MASPLVSLPSKNWQEFVQNYIYDSSNDQNYLNILEEMEKELGNTQDSNISGKLSTLISNLANMFYQQQIANQHQASNLNLYANLINQQEPQTQDVIYKIRDDKHQEFASLYREFVERFKKLENLENKIISYLESNKNKNQTIKSRWPKISEKMENLKKLKYIYLSYFKDLQFDARTHIFKNIANFFIIPTIKYPIKYLFHKKTIKIIAIGTLGFITLSSFKSSISLELTMKVTSALFFMYIGHFISKTFLSDRQYSKPVKLSIYNE